MACRILVVEDDGDLREMMAQLLFLEGFDPLVARDGLEAFDALHTRAPLPHVIVLDMMMPRMDGWMFCRLRDREPNLAAIPLVVLSAVPRDQLRSVRAVAVVSKPCDFFQLIKTVR